MKNGKCECAKTQQPDQSAKISRSLKVTNYGSSTQRENTAIEGVLQLAPKQKCVKVQ